MPLESASPSFTSKLDQMKASTEATKLARFTAKAKYDRLLAAEIADAKAFEARRDGVRLVAEELASRLSVQAETDPKARPDLELTYVQVRPNKLRGVKRLPWGKGWELDEGPIATNVVRDNSVLLWKASAFFLGIDGHVYATDNIAKNPKSGQWDVVTAVDLLGVSYDEHIGLPTAAETVEMVETLLVGLTFKQQL